MNRTGHYAIIEQLLKDDIHYMFGNPGTVEEGFLDALGEYPEFQYIMGLQETIPVAIADGYARITKKPTVVQLHSGVGLGNGIGMMYQAMRGHAPLVVLAGEAGLKYDAFDAQMACDLVSMAKPVTKWACRVNDASSLLRLLRRAIKIASTPPMGPTFLSLPMDILDEINNEEVIPTSIPSTRAVACDSELTKVAEILASADNPLFIIGDGIAFSEAQDELATLAEQVGAKVYGADSSEVNMKASNPLFQGLLGHMFGKDSKVIAQNADVVFICGTYVFPEVFPTLNDVFAKNAKLIHIDLNAYEIAKNFNVDIGLVADPKLSLNRLSEILNQMMNTEEKANALQRVNALTNKEKVYAPVPSAQVTLSMGMFVEALSKQLPHDAIIFDEALTSSPELNRRLPANLVGHYFQTRGGSLGVGIPGAIGMKLAKPNQTVIGFTGDGGSLYTIQALWTSAHHNIGAKFVICNNQSYKLLKLNILEYWRERNIQNQTFPLSFDITNPNIRFDQLALSLGVNAVRVEKQEDIEKAIQAMLADDSPFLLDLVLSQQV